MNELIARNCNANTVGKIAVYDAAKGCESAIKAVGTVQTSPCRYCYPVELDIAVFMDDVPVPLPIKELIIGKCLTVHNMTAKRCTFDVGITVGSIQKERE